MPPINARQTTSFDAKVLLNITPNQNHGGRFTCMGRTLQGRRCRNPRKEAVADDILSSLPRICHDRERLEDTIDELVYDVYCHLHRDQAPRERWIDAIREEARKYRSPRPSTRGRNASTTFDLSESQTCGNNESHLLCSPACLIAATAVPTVSGQSYPTRELPERVDGGPKDDPDEEPCPICLMPFSESSVPCETPCGHRFCFACIDTWLSDHKTCPFDRRPLQKSDIRTIALPRTKVVAP